MRSEAAVTHGPQRTHPATALFGFASAGFAVLLAVALPGTGILFELILAAFGLREIAQWWFRTFELQADDLVVSGGVLTRHEQIVPYHRVQQVDIHRGLLEQVFGLAELRIDTAGSSEGRVQLRLLALPTASAIRAHVLERRAHSEGAPAAPETGPAETVHPWSAPASPQRTILAVPAGRLLLAGATATAPVAVACIVTLAAAATALVGVLSGTTPTHTLAGAAAFAFLLVAATFALAAFSMLLQYAGLTVSEVGDDLRVDYGVFDKQHLTVPRRRVQHVSISDNPVRRLFGMVDVTVHSAAAPGAQRASHLTVVAFPRDQVARFLASLMQDPDWHVPALAPRSRAAHRRARIRRVALLCVPALVAAIAFFPAGLVSVAVAVAAGWLWGDLAHRRAGYAVTAGVAVFGAGAVAHRVHIVPRRRVQSARTSSSPLQRRVGLATCSLDVAGSPAPRLYDIDAGTAAELRTALPRTR
jgi:putative membrane protein